MRVVAGVAVWVAGAGDVVGELWFAGAVEPNAVVVPVDATGEVCVATLTATEVVVDVSGWFDVGSASRRRVVLVDTRLTDAAVRSVVPGVPLRVPVLGQFGVPGSGVVGVALNVTAVDPAGAGWLRVWPCGSPEPETSSVNYVCGGGRAECGGGAGGCDG